MVNSILYLQVYITKHNTGTNKTSPLKQNGDNIFKTSNTLYLEDNKIKREEKK